MMTFCPFLNGHFPSFYAIHGIFAPENENYFNIHLTNYYKSMNRVLLFAVSLLLSMTAFAQTPEPTVIDDLSTYTGSDPYVLNKADGKVYVLNNLKEYERYGVYENVADLKIATPVVQKDIEYIETRLNTATATGSATPSWCSIVPTRTVPATRAATAVRLKATSATSSRARTRFP